MTTSLRLPPEIEAAMKRLADEHSRSLHGEIIQACKAWIAGERKAHMIYVFEFEIASDGNINADVMYVQGVSEELARKFAEAKLEEEYPGEEGYQLMSLELKETKAE